MEHGSELHGPLFWGIFAPHAYTQPLMPMTDLRLGNTKFEIEVALALGMEAFV